MDDIYTSSLKEVVDELRQKVVYSSLTLSYMEYPTKGIVVIYRENRGQAVPVGRIIRQENGHISVYIFVDHKDRIGKPLFESSDVPWRKAVAGLVVTIFKVHFLGLSLGSTGS